MNLLSHISTKVLSLYGDPKLRKVLKFQRTSSCSLKQFLSEEIEEKSSGPLTQSVFNFKHSSHFFGSRERRAMTVNNGVQSATETS